MPPPPPSPPHPPPPAKQQRRQQQQPPVEAGRARVPGSLRPGAGAPPAATAFATTVNAAGSAPGVLLPAAAAVPGMHRERPAVAPPPATLPEEDPRLLRPAAVADVAGCSSWGGGGGSQHNNRLLPTLHPAATAAVALSLTPRDPPATACPPPRLHPPTPATTATKGGGQTPLQPTVTAVETAAAAAPTPQCVGGSGGGPALQPGPSPVGCSSLAVTGPFSRPVHVVLSNVTTAAAARMDALARKYTQITLAKQVTRCV